MSNGHNLSRLQMASWIEAHGVTVPSTVSADNLYSMCCQLPDSLPHAHDTTRAYNNLQLIMCAKCPRGIGKGSSYVRCQRCGIAVHCSCAKLFTSRLWPLIPDRPLRYMTFDALHATTEIRKLLTADAQLECFNVHSGLRVRLDRGTLRGKHGTIVGVGPNDGRLYCHVDGEPGAVVLFGSTVEEVVRVHGLHRVGSCARQPRTAGTLKVNTYDSFLSAGQPEEWRERPYGALCPQCRERFTTLTQCDACQLYVFEGETYEVTQWPALFARPSFHLHLASHAGTRHSIHGAVETGPMHEVRCLLESGFDVNDRSGASTWCVHHHRTPLHFAVLRCLKVAAWDAATQRAEEGEQAEVVAMLLSFGADVFLADDLGNTPLHYAAMFPPKYSPAPRFLVIRALLQQKADTHAVNAAFEVPLDLMQPLLCLYEDPESIVALLS